MTSQAIAERIAIGSPREAAAGRSRFVRDGLVLGLLTALGPFAIDMYLPSLPAIGTSLHVDANTALLTLTAYFVTFALGQLVFGPVSDMVGRKPPLYVGVLVFLGGTVGCALADDIRTLLVFRVVEGLGGAAGMVIARAVVRDLHSGYDEVRLLSLLMLVFSVSPVLAPLAGSFIISGTSWHTIFWLIAVLSVIGLVMAALFVPETRTRAGRGDDFSSLLAACRRLLSDREFMSLTMIGACAISGFFVFLANSSFVFTGQYGLSPRQYSLVFSVNAVAFFAGMQLSGRLGVRYGMRRLVFASIGGYASVMVLLTSLTAMGADSLGLVVGLLFVGFGFVGLIVPISSVLALADNGDVAGTASSLMSTLQLVVGAAVMAISSRFANGTVLPLVAGVAFCAVLAFVLALLRLRSPRPSLA